MTKRLTHNAIVLFKKVKLLVLDVDGVLTKGEIIYDDRGRELKIFNVKDGLGIFLLRKAGIKTLILTAKDSKVVQRRAKDMHIAEVIAGRLPKESVLNDIKFRYKVREDEICFIGDDLIDIGLMRRVGVAIAVADAPRAVRRVATYVTSRRGGDGAVREIVDLIFSSQGLDSDVNRLLATQV